MLVVKGVWLVVFAAVPVLAGAESTDTKGADRVASEFLDSNGDGRISYEEFVHSVAVKALREMDADKNGMLTRSEATVARSPRDATVPTITFDEADINRDGQVSLEELRRALHDNVGVRERFRNLDQDKDGFISRSEFDRSSGTGLPVVPQVRIPLR